MKNKIAILTLVLGLAVLGAGGIAAVKVTKNAPKVAAPPAAPPTAYAEQSQTILAVKAVRPAVVSIVVKHKLKVGGAEIITVNPQTGEVSREKTPVTEEEKEYGRGTGFIVRQDGMIVTNKHVVNADNPIITVFLNDGNSYPATVMGKDPLNDIAILKIEGKNFPTVLIGNSDDLEIGQTVLAVGNSLGLYQNTVTKGIVSGVGRSVTAGDGRGLLETIPDSIQTDASINHGNSGGPLITLDGSVVGINTATINGAQGVSFAIPMSIVTPIVSSLVRNGKIVHARMGVRFIMITPEIRAEKKLPVSDGAYLAKGAGGEAAIVPGGPGDKAGLREGDIITEINGIKLDQRRSLQNIIANLIPGTIINFKIIRGDVTLGLSTTLDEMPADAK